MPKWINVIKYSEFLWSTDHKIMVSVAYYSLLFIDALAQWHIISSLNKSSDWAHSSSSYSVITRAYTDALSLGFEN